MKGADTPTNLPDPKCTVFPGALTQDTSPSPRPLRALKATARVTASAPV